MPLDAAARRKKRSIEDFIPTDAILRLYMMEGNDAESVYFNLGFVPGVQEIQNMYIPPKA
ncbi:hypothetical protein [Paenibacillus apiarius]|uniref:hypothetical protein n=1 Tax=Paenibacillus apiarius TaxID=46240 RepID=UPI001F08A557|nr:hypothetical protein [Paenibacillus apiarius]